MTKQRRRGMTSAEEEAISPKVTMPLAKAWPEAPRMENAVMLVPNSDSRNTVGPSERPGEEIVLGVVPCGSATAKMPMYSTTPR